MPSPSPPPVVIDATRRLIDTAFLRIDDVTVRFRRADGTLSAPQHRMIVDRGKSVAALLLDPDTKRLHFVRQFRFAAYDAARPDHPDNGVLLELVAGRLEPGDDPEACILREVAEETGFRIAGATLIGRFFASPGAFTEEIFLFYAEVSEAARTSDRGDGTYGVDDEEIHVVALSIDAFLAMTERMMINDAKTLVAAEWLRRRHP